MRHGSLFSGIGGFDLASEWMGWDNVFHCEWNPFGKRVLNYYWPKAISHDDITKTDFTIHRGRIDILTGGFPCQPYSAAGKRLGKEDERHLWPEMLRAIREIQPTWIVGENVRGLTNWNGGMVFDEVQADLEAEGYEVTPFLLPACAVNAPHRRDRIWFIAYNSNARIEGVRSGRENSVYEFGITTNSQRDGYNGNEITEEGQQHDERRQTWSESASPFESRNVTDTGNKGLQRSKINGSTGGIRKESNQFFTGCIPSTWQEFPTQSPVCNGDDGLPSKLDGITFPKWRSESIKGGGNAIVPQVVYQIFKAIEQYDTRN